MGHVYILEKIGKEIPIEFQVVKSMRKYSYLSTEVLGLASPRIEGSPAVCRLSPVEEGSHVCPLYEEAMREASRAPGQGFWATGGL